MRVFLDTEFLLGPEGPVFLSAGFLTDTGLELYSERPAAEVEALLRLHPNPFVLEKVLPQFGRQPGVAWQKLPAQLAEWLDGLAVDNLDMVYDYSSDYLLVEQLLEVYGAPLRTRLHPTNVAYLLADTEGERAAISAWEAVSFFRGQSRHHALADAFALRARFEAVHPQVKRVAEEILELCGSVIAVVEEFELVKVDSDDGSLSFSVGKQTKGVDWKALHVGMRLRCIVKIGGGSRVLSAKVIS